MATYTITTTRAQEIGLSHMLQHYPIEGVTTKQQYLQKQTDSVTNQNYATYVRDSSVALDRSLNTIPEANRPAAQTEIETVITENGGTIIRVGDPAPPGPVGGVPIP